jgi:signal transduction histidine kinase
MSSHLGGRLDPGPRGDLLIVITVVVAYIVGFIGLGLDIGLGTWAVLIALGLIHLGLGASAHRMIFSPPTPGKIGLYFFLQTAICIAIVYLGQGVMWLVFMPLASTAAAIFPRRTAAIYYLLLLAVFTVPLNWRQTAYAVQNTLMFGCALVFVWIFTEISVREQKSRRDLERITHELETANARLRESAAQAEELARSRERNRLAREIHDSLGHYLTVVNVQLEAARALLANKNWEKEEPDLYAALDKAQALTRSGLADVRRSVAALRTDPIGEKPFEDAVQTLIAENREAGLLVVWRREGSAGPLPPSIELALFRILQEALTNVRKHARASRADVFLEYREETIRLEVRDNGVGFSDADDNEEKFGLRGIRERVEILQGKMEIAADPGGGVRLTVELPME